MKKWTPEFAASAFCEYTVILKSVLKSFQFYWKAGSKHGKLVVFNILTWSVLACTLHKAGVWTALYLCYLLITTNEKQILTQKILCHPCHTVAVIILWTNLMCTKSDGGCCTTGQYFPDKYVLAVDIISNFHLGSELIDLVDMVLAHQNGMFGCWNWLVAAVLDVPLVTCLQHLFITSRLLSCPIMWDGFLQSTQPGIMILACSVFDLEGFTSLHHTI